MAKPKTPPKNQSLTKSEKLNLRTTIIIGTLSLILTAVAIWYAKKGIDTGVEIAQKAGSFDKANNYLGILDLDLPPSATDTILLIYGGHFDKNSVNISSLPFSVGNYGQKNAEDIEFIIEFPKIFGLAFTDTSLLVKEDVPIAKFSRTVTENDDFQTVTYQLNHLNPGMRVIINEPCLIQKTQVSVSAKSRDSIDVRTDLEYSMRFTTTLLGKDLRTQKKIFYFRCVESQSMDDLIDHYVQNLERKKSDKKYYAYFFYPEKSLFHQQDSLTIHEYKVRSDNVYFGTIDGMTKHDDIALALYGNDQHLKKIRVYNGDNTFKFDLPVK